MSDLKKFAKQWVTDNCCDGEDRSRSGSADKHEFNSPDIYELVDDLCGDYESNNGWISVDDRLPEKYSWYLVVSSTKVTMAFYDGDTVNEDGGLWLVHNDNPDSDEWENVTHWMPLPEPPTK